MATVIVNTPRCDAEASLSSKQNSNSREAWAIEGLKVSFVGEITNIEGNRAVLLSTFVSLTICESPHNVRGYGNRRGTRVEMCVYLLPMSRFADQFLFSCQVVLPRPPLLPRRAPICKFTSQKGGKLRGQVFPRILRKLAKLQQ
ncbi:hypothetical protein J6590_016121 [Homalodisca vitripennis]|nr:hypothetical protein J6590_016121 [Homalodisca vitripennis]